MMGEATGKPQRLKEKNADYFPSDVKDKRKQIAFPSVHTFSLIEELCYLYNERHPRLHCGDHFLLSAYSDVVDISSVRKETQS